MQRVIASFALIVLSLLLCHKGFSQGRLLGRVVDGNGAPLPAATIYLSSSSSTQAALSNSDGYYVFLAIPEGEYSLKAFKRGLPKTDPVSVNITANTTTRKDFILGPTGGSVTLLGVSLSSARFVSCSSNGWQCYPLSFEQAEGKACRETCYRASGGGTRQTEGRASC